MYKKKRPKKYYCLFVDYGNVIVSPGYAEKEAAYFWGYEQNVIPSSSGFIEEGEFIIVVY